MRPSAACGQSVGMKSVLIATDGSAGAAAAVGAGLELARDGGGTATVVYVREPIGVLGEPFYQRKLSEQLAAADAAFAAARARAEEAGVAVETEVVEGDAAEAIADLAHTRGVDIVVVGSRGLGAVSGALLGSVSSAVVRRADRPVLVVKDAGEPSGA